MKRLRKEQYDRFINKFNLIGKKIIEIGCGRGEFLSFWKDYDVDVTGIEYSRELVELGKKDGLKIINDFIEDPKQHIEGAPYDAFCQFNFLEHQPYPNEMLQGIYNNLTDNGVGLVTVPSLEYILKYDGYYELIRDHIAYYSVDSLRFLFEKNGFEVCEIRTVNRDTHEIMVRKRSHIDLTHWKENFENLQKEINRFIDDNHENVAVWGASHQGFTLIPSLGIGQRIRYIIDSAKFKQGRFSPASHNKIVSPEYFFSSPVEAILIVAPGYTEEIARIIKDTYGSGITVATLKSNHLELI